MQKDDERVVPLALELRKVLSPEACGWLEGTSLKTNGKGKKPASASSEFALRGPAPPSPEKIAFDAAGSLPDDPIFPDAEDAEVEDSQRIPAGTLIEIRR